MNNNLLPYQCPFDEYRARTNSTLKSHLINIHKAKTTKELFSEGREDIPRSLNQVEKHNKSLRCIFCGKVIEPNPSNPEFIDYHQACKESKPGWLRCPFDEYRAKGKRFLKIHLKARHHEYYSLFYL